MPMSCPNTALNAVFIWSNAAAAWHSSSSCGADGTGHNAEAGIRPLLNPPQAADPPRLDAEAVAASDGHHPSSVFETGAATAPADWSAVPAVSFSTMVVACAYVLR